MIKRLFAFVVAAPLMLVSIQANSVNLAKHPEIQAIIHRLITQHDFDSQALNQLFAAAQYRPKIIQTIRKPAEKLAWHQYRKFFIYPKNIRKGAEFVRAHAHNLNRAEAIYGVPAEIIAAIIGVETRFGTHKGSHLLIDSLATLTVGYPRRSAFFGQQLEQLMILAREQDFDLMQLKGSYAGAMGIPQFIPTSYLAFAIDFDGDGQVNLLTSMADAIGSVANYLKVHHWQAQDPIISRVVGRHLERHVNRTLKVDNTIGALQSAGVRVVPSRSQDDPISILAFENETGPRYVAAHPNFFVITTYNRSQIYAMAVAELASSIRRAL